eukprot:gnl/Dysnectes_brevis/7063_a11497_218.p1 GENE.gnl/Dysnectes_brevis/7063_a11497_218~~gnl/Dysnectes_brevis/7063_a11497_218.p1  ORF type:complete len:520 (-),score=136.42 gnl/Dysnectes_brevis/7063_a11497_218:280-1839(-)
MLISCFLVFLAFYSTGYATNRGGLTLIYLPDLQGQFDHVSNDSLADWSLISSFAQRLDASTTLNRTQLFVLADTIARGSALIDSSEPAGSDAITLAWEGVNMTSFTPSGLELTNGSFVDLVLSSTIVPATSLNLFLGSAPVATPVHSSTLRENGFVLFTGISWVSRHQRLARDISLLSPDNIQVVQRLSRELELRQDALGLVLQVAGWSLEELDPLLAAIRSSSGWASTPVLLLLGAGSGEGQLDPYAWWVQGGEAAGAGLSLIDWLGDHPAPSVRRIAATPSALEDIAGVEPGALITPLGYNLRQWMQGNRNTRGLDLTWCYPQEDYPARGDSSLLGLILGAALPYNRTECSDVVFCGHTDSAVGLMAGTRTRAEVLVACERYDQLVSVNVSQIICSNLSPDLRCGRAMDSSCSGAATLVLPLRDLYLLNMQLKEADMGTVCTNKSLAQAFQDWSKLQMTADLQAGLYRMEIDQPPFDVSRKLLTALGLLVGLAVVWGVVGVLRGERKQPNFKLTSHS